MASTIRNLTVAFGLVSFEASLKKASEKKDVTFDSAVRVKQGEQKDGTPIYTYEPVRQIKSGARSGVAASNNGTATGDAEVVKGVWVGGDEFHPVPEGALEQIADATQIEGIEIEEFVTLAEVPWHRVEGAYYLTPMKGLIGAKPMRLLRDALAAEKKAGICKLCLKGTGGRQKLAALHVVNGMMLVNLLGFAEDFREADESARSVENVQVDKKLLRLARDLIVQRTVKESPLLNGAVDDAVAEREKLYVATIEADGYSAPSTPTRTAGPDDLMAALEASVAQMGAA